MSQSKPTKQPITARLKAELRRDPKRAAILGVLVLVFLIIGGREMVKLAGGPKKATAAPARATGSKGARSKAVPSAHRSSTGGASETGDAESLTKLPVDRDIFTPGETYFPYVKKVTKKTEKPMAARVVDPNALAESVRLETETLARSLTLETTVIGDHATAIINGQMLRVGQTINTFKVIEINSRSCQLERAGIRVVLEMGN